MRQLYIQTPSSSGECKEKMFLTRESNPYPKIYIRKEWQGIVVLLFYVLIPPSSNLPHFYERESEKQTTKL
jgi:hypothetical protein